MDKKNNNVEDDLLVKVEQQAKIKTSFSWTVMFIFIGVIVGSINTWRWLNENSKD